MNVLVNCFTDQGRYKSKNEDSLLVQVADTSIGILTLAVICDGMGGLQKGELASATVIRAFDAWFKEELPLQLKHFSIHLVKTRWEEMIYELNLRIREYGRKQKVHLGTTLTAMLLVDEIGLLIAHVGDSRAYEISDDVRVLTNDQTLVAREVKRGIITEEQALSDPRQHVLLQCIGESKNVTPDFIIERSKKNCTYMLCSDGFRHKISLEEMKENLSWNKLENEQQVKAQLQWLATLCMERKEKDNISAIAIRTL